MASSSASPTVAVSATSSADRTLAQAIATGVSGVSAFAIGTVLVLVSSYGFAWSVLISAVASPALLCWSLGVALLALTMRRGSAAGFAAIAVGLAPVASVIEWMLRMGPTAWAQLIAYPVMIVPLVWQSLGLFGAAFAGAVAGVLYRRARETPAKTPARTGTVTSDDILGTPHATDSDSELTTSDADVRERRPVLGAISTALLVMGSALAFALPGQWFDVYFHIWGDAADPTTGDATRYVWTASVSLVLLLGSAVVAILRRRAGLITLATLALCCALVGAFIFQVPQGRFSPERNPPANNNDGPVCYGTTGDCPGG